MPSPSFLLNSAAQILHISGHNLDTDERHRLIGDNEFPWLFWRNKIWFFQNAVVPLLSENSIFEEPLFGLLRTIWTGGTRSPGAPKIGTVTRCFNCGMDIYINPKRCGRVDHHLCRCDASDPPACNTVWTWSDDESFALIWKWTDGICSSPPICSH